MTSFGSAIARLTPAISSVNDATRAVIDVSLG